MKTATCFRILSIVIFLLPTKGYTQNRNVEKEKFYDFFAQVYADLSKPPLSNYFVNLHNTIKVSFSNENTFFVPALLEIAADKKISEESASDSLYKYSIGKLLKEKLWINYGEMLSINSLAFEAYNDVFCPCITANFKTGDELGKMMPVLQQCVSKFVTDTVAMNNIRKYAGDKTLNEIFQNQQYFSLFIYQNCAVVNQSLNEVLQNEAWMGYTSAVNMEKKRRALNLINYYVQNKTDSLSKLFPTFKKFTKGFEEAGLVFKDKNIRTNSSYFAQNGANEASLHFSDDEMQRGQLKITFADASIGAPISKISFKKLAIRFEEDRIEEIREDVAVPVKQ